MVSKVVRCRCVKIMAAEHTYKLLAAEKRKRAKPGDEGKGDEANDDDGKKDDGKKTNKRTKKNKDS